MLSSSKLYGSYEYLLQCLLSQLLDELSDGSRMFTQSDVVRFAFDNGLASVVTSVFQNLPDPVCELDHEVYYDQTDIQALILSEILKKIPRAVDAFKEWERVGRANDDGDVSNCEIGDKSFLDDQDQNSE